MKKHRLITVLAAALVGVSAAAFPTAAELSAPEPIVAEAANGDTFNYGNFEFTHGPGSSGATLTQYLGSSTTPSIPSQVYDWSGRRLTVKKIGAAAFQSQNSFGPPSPMNITSVTIPNSVTEIEGWAFANCPLTNVSFPDNLEKIGEHAFYGSSLNSVNLPSNTTKIGESAFEDCANLHAVNINGPAEIGMRAFYNCSSLYSLGLNSNCTLSAGDDSCPFDNCTSLTYLNGSVPWYLNNNQVPVITGDSHRMALIRRVFWKAGSVGFVDDYCDRLCQYVVDTETRWWMSEAVKARRLHDWLIAHCNYGHDSGYSVFLSFGMGEIGSGVCENYSRYYTMLLTKAGIESYVLNAGYTALGRQTWDDGTGHAWNLVKVDEKYYQVDVTWDDNGIPSYQHFLLSGTEMNLAHCQNQNANLPYFQAPNVENFGDGNHPLLRVYGKPAGQAALNQCVYGFNDTNYDGLLDNDYNFDGYVNSYDIYYRNQITPYFNNGYTPSNGGMTALLDYLTLCLFPTGDPLTPDLLLWLAQNGYHIQ